MNVVPAPWFQTPDGLLSGDGVQVSEKRLADAGFFADKEGVDPDTVLYRVHCLPSAPVPGHLDWGVSELQPVTVNGECCMTRGHWHEDTDAAEWYWCAAGRGFLLLMDENGEAWAEAMEPGTLHRIDGKLAHRLVNTGDEPLRVVCCWPSSAGHDYARCEAMPFPARCYKEGGSIVWR